MEVVPDFVDGAVFGFEQLAGCAGEGGFFEEEADLVAAR